MLEKEWTPESWRKQGTRTTRQHWATLSPLAWVLEYEPLILLPGVGEIPFHPYYAQQAFLNDQSTNRALNKMRQGGFSTVLSAAESVWKMLYRNNPSIACLSKNEADAVGFLDKFKLAYESIKDKDPNYRKLDAKTKVARNGNGVIKVLSAGKGSGRSISATDVYFDEMPHAQYSDEIYTSSYPTISKTKGRFTLFSTPKGKGNKFSEICTNPSEFGYSYHEYPWYFVPDYNPAYPEFIAAYLAGDQKGVKDAIAKAKLGKWYRATFAALGEMAFAQEYECNFDASADMVFSSRQLANVFRKNYLTEMDDEYGDVWRDLEHPRTCEGDHTTFMDFGRKRDPTVIVTLCDRSDVLRLIEFTRITPMSFLWDFVTRSFRETQERYQSDCYHDGTGNGDAVTIECSDFSTAIMINDNGLSKIKSNAIANTQRACDNKAVVLPNLPVIHREFEQYRYNDKKLVQDCVMAIVFCLYKAYDPSDSYTGVDTSYSYTGV